MCCIRSSKRSRRIHHKNKAKKRRIQVAPLPLPEWNDDERLLCHGCNQYHPMGKNGIQIHCAGCDQFYHCRIAGTCQGPYCKKETRIGTMHNVAWCIDCVPSFAINCEKKDRNERCVCERCFQKLDST